MFVLGVFVALSSGVMISWVFLDLVTFLVALCSMISACIFAIITNDLVDESIDRISNPERPLVTGALTTEIMRDGARIALLSTLLGGLALGSYALFWLSVFTAAYYVYSAPPLRLKRVPVLSSFFIGLASVSFMLLGFYLVSYDQTLLAFPGRLAFLVVASMMLLTNVRDLKDIDGDRAAGINTLPVILGDRRARRIMGIMALGAYALVPLCIPVRSLWVPSLIAGLGSWYLLEKGRTERAIFSVYFVYLVGLVAMLYFEV
jgi:4-hydroxybenzoate polyprenyltransferase